MRIDIITIFPSYFESPLKVGLLGKAIEKGLIKINILNLRDFAEDKHKIVDDEPFGGGEGMIFKPEPLYKAITSIKKENPEAKIIYLSPQGTLLTQKVAEKLVKNTHLVLICGRYEGIDERIKEHFVDEEISIGDYVVFGGEVASLVLVETLARLIPGVVGKKDSVEKESFTSGLLKYPCYTRPREFLGYRVPEILLSGNHAKIEEYRKKLSIELTLKKRPYLLKNYQFSEKELEILKEVQEKIRFYIFLLHHPVYNKNKEIITSAITNFDLHDLGRTARTYGVKGLFIIQPLKDQRELAERIKKYWTEGKGAKYNPLRKEALELVEVFSTLEEAEEEVVKREGEKPILLGTDASPKRKYISYESAKKLLWEKPVALVLGTAWGLSEEFLNKCDYFLEPIWGRIDPYNHLSVRCAGAILLDRILGPYAIFKKPFPKTS
jgi:tRNA (guanine37-N1)-methyltransferase